MGCTLSIELDFPARRRRHRRHQRRHHIPVYRTASPEGFLEAVLGPEPVVCQQATHGVRRTIPQCGTVTRSQQAKSHEHDIPKPRSDEEAKNVDAAEPTPPKTETAPAADTAQETAEAA